MRYRWSLLLPLLLLCATGTAQGQKMVLDDPDERPSHRPVGSGLESVPQPEAWLEQRLRSSRLMQMHQEGRDREQLQGDFRAMVQRLLRDPKFLDSIRASLSPEEVERMRKRFEGGEPLSEDGGLQKLLQHALGGEGLSAGDAEALRRLAEQLREKGLLRPPENDDVRPATPEPGAAPPPSTGADATGGALPRPLEDRAAEWGREQIGQFVRDLDQWLESPSGQSWAAYLKTLAQRYEESGRATAALRDQASRLSRYLPRVSDYLPRTPLPTPTPTLPRMPSIGPLPLPSALAPGSLASSGRGALWLVGLIAVAALLWWGRGVVFGLPPVARRGWQIGPWPVRPGDVATRGDLVRAFEYLALLRLGPDARTHHHLDLAARLGGQPDVDPDRRRDAASFLARLYETSRYAPEDTPLVAEELLRARRDLGYLAGEPAA